MRRAPPRSSPPGSRSPSRRRPRQPPRRPRRPCASTSSASRRGEAKVAYLLAARRRIPAPPSRVVDASGTVVLSGARRRRAAAAGTRAYGAVQPLDLSALTTPGTYRIEVAGPPATSPPFRIAPRRRRSSRHASTTRSRSSRRSAMARDVIAGPLHRKPVAPPRRPRCAVTSGRPTRAPTATSSSARRWTPLPGRTDLEGGWFDAGDFIKFTHTTAYAVVLMFAADRELGTERHASLVTEAHFGLDWLRKAWSPKHSVLYLQVGIGSGNQQGTFNGDHDLWRLPERDDSLTGAAEPLPAQPARRSVPTIRARPLPPEPRRAASRPRSRSPRRSSRPPTWRMPEARPRHGRAHLRARQDDPMSSPADVVTALPHAFYPESSVARRPGARNGGARKSRPGTRRCPRSQLARGPRHWARAYLATRRARTRSTSTTRARWHTPTSSSALRAAHRRPHDRAAKLLGDLRAQLGAGQARAQADPFRAGAVYSDFDAVAHTFGLVTTATLLYQRLTGSDRYARSRRRSGTGRWAPTRGASR